MISAGNSQESRRGPRRSFHGSWPRWAAALLTSLVLICLPRILQLDGKPHDDWQQFLGRFHPLAVHIPIGLLLLLPVLEIAGARKPALREAAELVLGLACASCLGTLALGYLLAFGSGEAGPILARHLWGGIALSIGLMVASVVRPAWANGTSRFYPAILGGVIAALLWTAHQGGSLTHGEGYLSAYLPPRLRSFLAPAPVNTGHPITGNLYAKRVQPILDANCIACHGPRKSQGGLRLDSYEELLQGGKDGQVLVWGDPAHSLLLQRIVLPADNPKVMPAEGRPLLKPEEIAVLLAWVKAGASPKVETLAELPDPTSQTSASAPPIGDYSAWMRELAEMRASQGPKLLPVSGNPSDGLILTTADAPESFDDAALARFKKFAPYIVEVDLARTAVTDKCFETLSAFTSLRTIHLEGSLVTGTGVEKLGNLSLLSYLNLSETKLTPAALTSLRSLTNLKRIYTFDIPAQPASHLRPSR